MRKLTGSDAVLILATLYLIAANLVWIAIDTRPPFWDMAYHQSAALRIYDQFASDGIHAFTAAAKISGHYPPLYYFVTALFYAVFGKSVDAAQWANLPALILLAFSTFMIARRLLEPPAAALAAILANFFPFMLWISRESLIDYWLVALVAASVMVLLRTDEFSDTRWSFIFGVMCGLGMLTKWTFALYVWLPAIWYGRKHWKNALLAAGVTCVISAYWYVPQAGILRSVWQLAAQGGKNEGDPAVLSWQSVVFYVRALEGYQLFLPLFAIFVVGVVILLRSNYKRWIPVFLWLLGGWLGLVLIGNKDPRYSAPLLPAVAVICAVPFQKRQVAGGLLLALLIFQHYLVSFGIPWLPPKMVLARGVSGPISWDWNVYTQNYLDVWGKPLNEDWQIERTLKEITASHKGMVRLGIIPDIPRFDSHAFEFYINLRHYPVVINKLWTFDEPAYFQNDYLLFSEDDQGFLPLSVPDWRRINSYVADHSQQFRMVDRFKLPGGQSIRLYEIDRAH
jgi:4-amino-4-deoxy-L-arabinose transferase-like glycosyltransferase